MPIRGRYLSVIAAEIERKFLTRGLPDEKSASPAVEIAQGYLLVEEDLEIRVRKAGDVFTLTLKHGHGQSRGETELDLSRDSFGELWPLTEGQRIEKGRSRVELEAGLTAEVDLYGGGLDGLSVVEVEFGSVERSAGFSPPSWFGREVTGDREWANQSLAIRGRPKRKLEFRLRPDEDPGAGLARVVAARSSQAAAAVRQAGSQDDPADCVHQARKSLKKARSALRLLRGAIPDEERRRVNGALRAAGAELSGARDAEVKIATLDSVTGTRAAWPGLESSFESLEEQAAAHRNALSGSSLARTARAIDEVRRAFAERELEVEPEVVAGNLGRTYRRGRRALTKASESDHPGDFHGWRKRAKDLRYQLEILGPDLPPRYKSLRKKAKELGELLGDTHDLDVLIEDLEGRGLNPGASSGIAEVIGLRRREIAEDSLRLGADVYSVRPRKFTKAVLDDFAVDRR